ncbi:bifunctional aspartate transaminase/aspartate 4-decarboxylase [uncultured Megasphaera sp.]|jgi:aspartate 4-decarboxylase|uniref:bifunctional aspartate transaminase/aspartate 4-decarboxylase n=1 Tax=uncultured Megasphaera sp. TaxID=165188 RepID=UPI00258A4ADF|nr:bifunctional aspartate transaminase/aspartate 4-decarboxylase [uncultured Megasphaera sp.]
MITKAFERKLETLGAFEISNNMLTLAQGNEKHKTFLNAGRGNPNWINSLGRLAFNKWVEFGVSESERSMLEGDLAGYIDGEGIVERFADFFSGNDKVSTFIKKSVDYMVDTLQLDRQAVILEFANGAVGNNYPVPSRCLVNLEKVLNAYLERALYPGTGLAQHTRLFPVEGGTAAIVYIFDSLKHNGLLKEGDKIAINMPIFTPYIQIPRLTNFELAEINVTSTEDDLWEIPVGEMEKLLDPSIKAFFLVNPSNPGSHAFGRESLTRFKTIMDQRKDMIVITDDVYGTFVNGFTSVYGIAPYNTLLVYSFSKLFGCTGWRLGVIGIHDDNVFNHILDTLPEDTKKILDSDYSIVTMESRQLHMIDRICADSRSIGLYHTSGLSTPQQIQMGLFALTHLLAPDPDPYFTAADNLVARRYHTLYNALGIPEDDSITNAKYYTILDMYHIAEVKYDKAFREYLEKNYEQIDFLLRLSKEEGVVLMEGLGFDAPSGTMRVSQANLPEAAYAKIGHRILQLLEEYHDEYVKQG